MSFELLYSQNPTYDQFVVWNSSNLSANKHKLDSRAFKCVFLGVFHPKRLQNISYPV